MATKLKNLQLTSVDLVRAGANQEADICLYKSAEGAVDQGTGLFKRLVNWLRDDHRDSVEKAEERPEIDRETALAFTDALAKSILSIHEDGDLDDEAKIQMIQKSFGQFNAAVANYTPFHEEQPDQQDPVVEKSEPDFDEIEEIETKKSAAEDFDVIEEVQKFNPYHDSRGRFASASGGAAISAVPSAAGGKHAVLADEEQAPSGAAGGKFHEVGGQEMHDAFYKAYDTMTDEVRWRVGTDYSAEDYEHAKCLVTEGGSTIVVKPDGDIVSVCKAAGDKVRAGDMLKTAVENGGTKLDAFGEKLYNLYTKNGFEPVSQCKFVDEYAPDAWIRANGFKPGDTSWFGKPDAELTVPREDITFFKYTGQKTAMSYEEFHSKTELHDDYGVAQGIRDGGMK